MHLRTDAQLLCVYSTAPRQLPQLDPQTQLPRRGSSAHEQQQNLSEELQQHHTQVFAYPNALSVA